MAERFSADPPAAGQVSKELAEIRSAMGSMGRTFDGFDGAVGSSAIEEALEEFFSESSDNRESMEKLLKRASGLLRGLAEGTTSVDGGLAGSLTPSGGRS
jgi:hypothetical protein